MRCIDAVDVARARGGVVYDDVLPFAGWGRRPPGVFPHEVSGAGHRRYHSRRGRRPEISRVGIRWRCNRGGGRWQNRGPRAAHEHQPAEHDRGHQQAAPGCRHALPLARSRTIRKLLTAFHLAHRFLSGPKEVDFTGRGKMCQRRDFAPGPSLSATRRIHPEPARSASLPTLKLTEIDPVCFGTLAQGFRIFSSFRD
jgi:hypothetical protein